MGLQFPHSQGRHHNNSTMALIAGYTLTPAHIGGPWSLTGPYTVAQNTQVILRGGLGKREAEPEADAYYGLGGYGGYGATYGLVSGCHNAYGAPVPCRGKRSAEAWYGLGGAGAWLGGYGAAVPPTGLPVQPLVTAWNGAVVPRKTPAVEAAEADHFAPSGARGLLTLRLMPTTAMEDMVDTDSAATEPTTLATVMEAMARGLLTLRLMPTTAMAAMVDTDSAATEPTTLATVMEAMARGLLTLRLMPTTVMEDMVDTDSSAR